MCISYYIHFVVSVHEDYRGVECYLHFTETLLKKIILPVTEKCD